MTMTPEVATLRIVRQLADIERGIDELIARNAELMSTMALARINADATLATGHHAMMRVAAGQQHLIGYRSDLIRAHADLLKVGQERGGMADGCPPPSGVFEADSVVAA